MRQDILDASVLDGSRLQLPAIDEGAIHSKPCA
jgi:hypothetical protein